MKSEDGQISRITSLLLYLLLTSSWLFRVDIPNSVLVLSKAGLYSADRRQGSRQISQTCNILQSLAQTLETNKSKYFLRLFPKGSDATGSSEALVKKLKGDLEGSDSLYKVGIILDEPQKGNLADAFNQVCSKDLKTQRSDISAVLEQTIGHKKPSDLVLISLCSQFLQYFFSDCISEVISVADKGEQPKLDKVSDQMIQLFEANKERYCQELGLASSFLEYTFSPSLQIGENANLKLNPSTNSDKFVDGCIILRVSVKYFDLLTFAVRTFFINTGKEEEEIFKVL
jgi:nucleosome binding factor SPN SPT16 subunit